MAGKKGATHFGKGIIDDVLRMKAEGKTNKEISVHFGFSNKRTIKDLITRYNRKQQQSGENHPGRVSKQPQAEVSKDKLITQLQMENELLRSFLYEIGRR